MKKLYLAAISLVLFSAAFSQIPINSLSTTYTQNFNTLASSGTSSALPIGWLFTETGSNANTTYTAGNGSLNSGDTYSYGATANTERAFGTLRSGSLNATIGTYFTNNSGSTITSFTIDYFGEEWRLGVAGRTDVLDFQYSTNATSLTSGTYTDVNELDFVTPNTTATAGALDGNATANRLQKTFTVTGVSIANGATFYIRWIDIDISGSDDGLAIDDFTISFNGTSLPACTTPSAQPTALTFGTITNTTIAASFSFASPAADKYLVLASTSNTLTATPQDGTAYADDDVIGNAKVVTATSANSFTATNLTPGTTYYFFVFAYNSNCTGGPLYNSVSPLSGPASTTAPAACVAPATAPGAITLNAANTSINGSFVAAATADGYLVIRSTNSAFTFTPVNGTSYAIEQTVGTTGTVIKYSAGTTFSTTGLTSNTVYYFFVYSINNFNCTGGPLYNSTPATANISTTNNSSGEPAGYYASATGKTCADLKTTLKTIITTGMTPRTYGDLWTQYTVSDIKPREVGSGSANVIWDIYSDIPGPSNDPYNFTPVTNQCGNYTAEAQCYNREHSFPQSWFTTGTTPGPGTDYHHIFPTDGKVNAIRGSYIYGEVASATTTSLNGSKLGSSSIAGFSGPVFEPINEYKGDVARAFLYMVTRYEDNIPTWGNLSSSNGLQALDPNTYPSVDIPYLQLMIKWHNQDPVSQKEIDRNNAAYSFQINRNPFVDHPEYVNLTWNNTCPSAGALPIDILYFGGKLSGDKVLLEWKTENEFNFHHFEIERSFNGTSFNKIGEVKAANLGKYNFIDDANASRGQRVYYRLKNVDKDGRFKYSLVFTLHIPLNVKFSVFPNPANKYIALQMNGVVSGSVTVLITELSGKIVHQQTSVVNGGNINIGTAALNTGTYIVKMIYKGGEYIQKVMVVK